MNSRLLSLQRRCCRTWLSLLGITLLLLLAGCSSVSGTQTSTPTSTSPTTPAPTASYPPTTIPTFDWATLESKPLHLPTISAGSTCPVTPAQQHIAPDHQYAAGNGPVYLVNEAVNNPVIFLDAGSSDPGSPWKISKVFWEISGSYTGQALVRGRQIDGAGALNFNGGLGQSAGNNQGTEPILHELRLQGDAHGEWKTYLTFVRIKQAGCYAFQIDGLNFSENIIIRGTVG